MKPTILALALAAPVCGQPLSDVRPASVADGISDEEATKGRALLDEAQKAYGLDAWKSYRGAEFDMVAKWYVPARDEGLAAGGWPEDPQMFHFTALQLGADDADLVFLNGPTKGEGWALADGRHFDIKNGEHIAKDAPDPHVKVPVKNWWFQFPFRISEAEFIGHGGTAEVGGKTYELVYATWGSAEPNETYDQYVIYIDPTSKRMEWLYFTYRKMVPAASISMHLSDFHTVDGVLVPHHYMVYGGAPGASDRMGHENSYANLKFIR